MGHKIINVSVLGSLFLAAGLIGCSIEDAERAPGADRGTWQPTDRADENASCSGSCGDQSAAGCWCDDACAEYGDCCPDKGAVCDGNGGGGNDGAQPNTGEPGAALGSFEFTYYWVTEESAFGGANTAKLYDNNCNTLATVSQGFANAIKLEGTGRLNDGRVLNYWGACNCSNSPCYFEVDASHPWGHGVQNRALSPYRSVAVDKNVVAYGTMLYIAKLDGVQMPGDAPWGGFVHDGCVSADDTGSAINGKHLDFFAARKPDYLSLNGVLGVSHVDVREGGERCAGGGGVGDGGNNGGGGNNDPVPPPGGGGDDLCFGTTCMPLVPASSVGSGYSYPSPLNGNANYRKPIRYIDLEAVGNPQIATNFKLSEVAQTYKGRYAVVQPHAIARLQALRNQVGALKVNSGYRSPTYNSSVGGATHSRHMFGDAFDLAPVSVSINTLESACTNHGGKLVEYTSHVHCDWRYDSVDSKLFGDALFEEPPLPLSAGLSATLQDNGGLWSAPAEGFDEGEPMRRWKALDADGDVIFETTGESFAPPSGTATIEVTVGAQIELSTDLD